MDMRYLIQDTTLINIADQVRTLQGTTDEMSTSSMIAGLQDVNTEIDDQAELISQIVESLINKITYNK